MRMIFKIFDSFCAVDLKSTQPMFWYTLSANHKQCVKFKKVVVYFARFNKQAIHVLLIINDDDDDHTDTCKIGLQLTSFVIWAPPLHCKYLYTLICLLLHVHWQFAVATLTH